MNQVKQNQLYANLMDEVKARIEVIDAAAQGRMPYPTPIIREFCYLQLRMLCELIALSCLVAHGDITFLQSHKIGKRYSADDILDRMTDLRPGFYPLPCRWRTDKRPHSVLPAVWNMEFVPSPLPKAKLLELYGKTHRYLHRGNLKKIVSSETPIDMNINMPEIIGWAQKIHDLLAHHTIVINKDWLRCCILRNKEDNNRVFTCNLTTTPPSSHSRT